MAKVNTIFHEVVRRRYFRDVHPKKLSMSRLRRDSEILGHRDAGKHIKNIKIDFRVSDEEDGDNTFMRALSRAPLKKDAISSTSEEKILGDLGEAEFTGELDTQVYTALYSSL